ncbi:MULTISPECIES: GIY-YIG nuclease family protein [Bacillus]|uniref:GIY-YIG nuclease family protein n=1 Tax=Bacillus TaxID=1386 RepID=UPI000BF3D9E6|nr:MULTISPECIES: GIY-YIG nuclease family protein [Bacillus]KAF6700420.1 GIY-YIG nuclease family protein [Bacillus sp. EKM501B]PFS08403.1 hypothetical protein COK60_01595 [Bacillus thuringiensis]
MLQKLTINSNNISEFQSIFQIELKEDDEISIHQGKANSKIYVIQKEQDVNVILVKGSVYSISYRYKFPDLFRQYARWNASKKIAQYDQKHIKAYGEIQITPAKAGLYILYDRNGVVIYVGMAENLNTRLYSHLNSSEFKDHIYLIDTYLIEDYFDKENLETCIINTLFPVFNIDKTLYPSQKERYSNSRPYKYSDSELTSLEEGAEDRKITPVDNLLISLWEKNNTNVPVGSEYNWIKDQRTYWIEEIGSEFGMAKKAVLQDALTFTRRASELGEEDILDKDLKNNIFTSSVWIGKFQW